MSHRPALNRLELKIPPLALVLIMGLMMWLGTYFPKFNFRIPFQSIAGWMIGVLGILTSVLGVIEFKRAKTTVNPTKPQSSTSLVRAGIYRLSRNPMYLGFFLMLAGLAALIPNILAFLALPLFVLYMNQFQIKPEERALALIFGDEFKGYCSAVRRWI